jgi:glycosyltransferase involved in cell wall biosynthesis
MSSQDHSANSFAPLVSVSITSFNSEKWLPKALDSVLLQQTGFPIEVVIGDDCSADGTIAVARFYQERNPELIRVLERTENLGMQRNYYETFEQCRGKYIAWLDADDYWTDSEKLTAQVQVLESDPRVNVCSHFVRWVTSEGEVMRERYPSISPGRYGLAEIIRHNFVPSPSIMFRNGIHRDLPKWFFDLTGMADWPVLVLAGSSGDIVLLDRVMADYMLAPASSMTSKGSLYWYAMDVQFYEHIESILPSEWHRFARAGKGKRYESMSYLLRKQGDFTGSRDAAVKAFRSPALMDNLGSKTKALIAAVVREAESKLRQSRVSI